MADRLSDVELLKRIAINELDLRTKDAAEGIQDVVATLARHNVDKQEVYFRGEGYEVGDPEVVPDVSVTVLVVTDGRAQFSRIGKILHDVPVKDTLDYLAGKFDGLEMDSRTLNDWTIAICPKVVAEGFARAEIIEAEGLVASRLIQGIGLPASLNLHRGTYSQIMKEAERLAKFGTASIQSLRRVPDSVAPGVAEAAKEIERIEFVFPKRPSKRADWNISVYGQPSYRSFVELISYTWGLEPKVYEKDKKVTIKFESK